MFAILRHEVSTFDENEGGREKIERWDEGVSMEQ